MAAPTGVWPAPGLHWDGHIPVLLNSTLERRGEEGVLGGRGAAVISSMESTGGTGSQPPCLKATEKSSACTLFHAYSLYFRVTPSGWI